MRFDDRAENESEDEYFTRRCWVYSAGLELMERIAVAAEQYKATPGEPWRPKGTTRAEMAAEIDSLVTDLEIASLRARELVFLALNGAPDDE